MNIINQLFPEVISLMICRKVTRSNMSDVMKQLTDIRAESITNTGDDNIYNYIITYPNKILNLDDWRERNYDERYEEMMEIFGEDPDETEYLTKEAQRNQRNFNHKSKKSIIDFDSDSDSD